MSGSPARRHIWKTARCFCSAMVALVVALSLAGCQVAGSRPVLKIGLSAPFTGWDESVGYSVIGAVRLAIRERNLAGGVAGYSVELVALDDGNEPERAGQRARELAADPTVLAVLGGFDDDAALASAAECERLGMPFVAVAAPLDELTTRGYGRVFRLTARDSDVGSLAGRYADMELRARRVAVIGDGTVGSNAQVAAFARVVEAGGAAIVYRGVLGRWQTDVGAVAREIAAAAPDVIFVAGRAAEAGPLLVQLRTVGVQATVLGGAGLDDARLVNIAGTNAQDVRYVSVGFHVERLDDVGLRDHLVKASLRTPGPYTVVAYDGTRVVLDALDRALRAVGTPTRRAVTDALRLTRYRGLSGDIEFDQQGNRQTAPLGVFMIVGDRYPGVVVP